MPHLPRPSSVKPLLELGGVLYWGLRGLGGWRPGFLGCGTSKTCNVDLSDVHASIVPEGLKRREKMVAWSMPRRSSAILAQLLVAHTRISVPCTGKHLGFQEKGQTHCFTGSCQELAVRAKLDRS